MQNMRTHLFLLCVAAVVSSNSDVEDRAVSAKVESCTGCSLKKYPEIRSFIEMDVPDLRNALNKRKHFQIFLDGKDVTPKPLVFEMPRMSVKSESLEYVTQEEIDMAPSPVESTETPSSGFRFSMTSPTDLGWIEQPYSKQEMQEFFEHFSTPPPKEIELIPSQLKYKKPQAALTQADSADTTKPKIILSLKETPTFFLFERPSITAIKGTEEGNRIEKDNELYDYLTVGKGRHRYTKNAEVQTKWTIWKSKDILVPGCEMKDNIAVASADSEEVTFREVPGLSPQLIFFNQYDQELERHELKHKSRSECITLLLQKGFYRKMKKVPEKKKPNIDL